MIEPLITEQYLPCSHAELYGTDNRKKLPEDDTVVGLGHDILLVPMNKGFKLSTRGAVLYASDSSAELLRVVARKHRLGDLLNRPEGSKAELERFHSYGLLAFYPAPMNGKLEIMGVPDRLRGLYVNEEFSWFSYFPSRIELDLSNRCNYQCIHCSRQASSSDESIQNELRLDEIKVILSDAAKNGILSLQLMGGEPFLHPHFFDICEHAKRERIQHLATSSNGSLIHKETAKRLAGYFDEIQLSLHGAVENTHDEIVGNQGAWRKIRAAAEALSANGVKVRLSFTIMERNVGEIESMPAVAKELGAASIRFLSLSNQGRGKDLKGWCKEERSLIGSRLRKMLLKEKERNTGLGIQCGGFPPLEPIRTNALFYGCPAGRELLYIGADGRTSCCGVVEEYVGNIRCSPVLKLWHHPKMVELRKSPGCDCTYRPVCAGPCVGDFRHPYSDKVK
jgi:radical SAM protein with 4Fe4S-binding SPASM domain